jgi:hypothetical protein
MLLFIVIAGATMTAKGKFRFGIHRYVQFVAKFIGLAVSADSGLRV